MRYAIVINLDYANNSETSCQAIWKEIKTSMINHGFICDGRIFTIDTVKNQAYELAREAIDSIESHMDYHEKRIFMYLKEFYGFNMATTTNLLLPPDDAIRLED